jgi:transmembrane sensor
MDELKSLFNQYLAGNASPQQVRQLLNYFRLEKESGLLTELIFQELEKSGQLNGVYAKEREPVYQRVQQGLNKRIDEQQLVPVPLWRKPFIRFAVAAMLLMATGLALWKMNQQPPVMLTVSVPFGKMQRITLPDSSKIWLNAGTTIQYPDKFDDNTRRIVLKNGQAFFEIVHDPSKPFIVTTNGADVQVLGTSFEVSSFEHDQEMKVTVSTGKVGVMPATVHQPATFLLPGDRAIINRFNHALVKSHIDTADIAAWRSNRLVFADQMLPEVFASLERKYNVHIQIENERLFNERVTMRLNNQPLDNVLIAISFSNHFTFKKINDQLVIVR